MSKKFKNFKFFGLTIFISAIANLNSGAMNNYSGTVIDDATGAIIKPETSIMESNCSDEKEKEKMNDSRQNSDYESDDDDLEILLSSSSSSKKKANKKIKKENPQKTIKNYDYKKYNHELEEKKEIEKVKEKNPKIIKESYEKMKEAINKEDYDEYSKYVEEFEAAESLLFILIFGLQFDVTSYQADVKENGEKLQNDMLNDYEKLKQAKNEDEYFKSLKKFTISAHRVANHVKEHLL